jgi:hypothetical protein
VKKSSVNLQHRMDGWIDGVLACGFCVPAPLLTTIQITLHGYALRIYGIGMAHLNFLKWGLDVVVDSCRQ